MFNIKISVFLLLFVQSINISAQWIFDPAVNNLISSAANNQQDARPISDGHAGAIIAWQDFRQDATNKVSDIYAQRINNNGIIKWTSNGVAICTNTSHQSAHVIAEDGTGGAIIAWNDHRNGNRDIYAQRIDSLGNVSWAANGISVVTKNRSQSSPKICSDGANGAIIIWEDSINGTWDLYAQRINAAGNLMWASTGVIVCNATNSQINPKTFSDGAGGVILTWQDKRSGFDYDIYAQRINSSGVAQWTANGVLICNAADTQSNPKIDSDNNGGAIVVWQDKRSGDYNVYAQRINGSGVVQWTANGALVCNAAGSQSAIDIVTEGVSGVIVAWKDARSGKTNIYTQKLDLNGAASWSSNGLLLSNANNNQINPNTITDGAGGAIIVWQDSASGNWDVYTQKISSVGNPEWQNGGVVIGNAANNQESPKNVSDGSGGSIFSFQDNRSGNLDIYASHINALGEVTAKELYSNNSDLSLFPNPSNGNVFIRSEHNENITFKVYDVAGKIVYTEQTQIDGLKIMEISLNTGVYFYTIETIENNSNTAVQKGKLLIVN